MGELTPQRQFEERIKDRLRDDIGDLIPDETLASLIQQAMQEMFFTKRIDRSNYRDKEYPSWFENTVHEALQKRINRALGDYFENNRDFMAKAIQEVITEKLPELMAEALRAGFNNVGYNMGMGVSTEITNAFQNSMGTFRS